MKKIYVDSKEQLDALFNDSALTLEGLSEESIEDFEKWILNLTKMNDDTFYIISGEMMNESYGLTGTNRYQDDLTIVSVMLSSLDDPGTVIFPRFEIGGRWFDDIVSNNIAREEREYEDL